MELAEIRNALQKTREQVTEFRGSLDLEELEARIQEIDEIMSEPGFWDNQEQAQVKINESNSLKAQFDVFHTIDAQQEELEMMYEMLKEEPDEELQADTEIELKKYQKVIADYELSQLLDGTYDRNNVLLELHPGAGGTESQDWCDMLLRMYTRWAEKHRFSVETLDYQAGEEAGVKSVTLLIKGENAYGYMKSEKGIHRLVRISPFDSAGRRHTSFVSCDIMPELTDEAAIEIRPEDLRVDTYRASGAGGQHINKTDSAVRLTHIPTGLVAASQSERSQIKNREHAMSMLKARIAQKQEEEKAQQLAEIRGEQKEIGWGSQIRSYVFHPYSMVKDHRTNAETGNVQAVMDGDLDLFIDAYLRLGFAN
ncbi:peptide chain release factor 2 [Brochothrix campestris]|uniref:peptide chain release factor 2 n=1 Tax=Brochothrix campestris TaxID=2757 RepID=UPI0038D2413F